MVIRNKKIISYYSFDGYEWLKYAKTNINIDSGFYAGIFIDFDESDYYNWLFGNYIQIHCCADLKNTYDGSPLEFFYPIQKNYNYYLIHPLIDYKQVPKIQTIKYNTIEFIKDCINNSEYIELRLNEFYIESRWVYQKHDFEHPNLVYGYNDDKEIIYLLGFDKKELFSKQEVKFLDFEKSFIESTEINYLTLFKQNFSYTPYRINLGKVIMYLKDYMNSTNSSIRFSDICTLRERIFGISFYDCILSNEANLKCLYDDIRISHLLYEHKKCMKERIIYLYKRELLSEDDYKNIYPIFKLMEEKSIILRNLILTILFNFKNLLSVF